MCREADPNYQYHYNSGIRYLAVLCSVLTVAALGLAPSTTPGFVAHRGTQLSLDGSPWRFTGVNAYELATSWGINAGCGDMVGDAQMDSLFASLRPGSAVRFWAFQGLATNYISKQRDWRPIDRVVQSAARHGQKLIMVLSGQGRRLRRRALEGRGLVQRRLPPSIRRRSKEHRAGVVLERPG